MEPLTLGVKTRLSTVWVVVPKPTKVYFNESEISGYLNTWYPVPWDPNSTIFPLSNSVISVPARPAFATLKESLSSLIIL